jgi:hypothetical protein
MKCFILNIAGLIILIASPYFSFSQKTMSDSLSIVVKQVEEEKKIQYEHINNINLQDTIIKNAKKLNKIYDDQLTAEKRKLNVIKSQFELINLTTKLGAIKNELVLWEEYKSKRESYEEQEKINQALRRKLDSIQNIYNNKKIISESYNKKKIEFCREWYINIQNMKLSDYFDKIPPNATENILLDSCSSIFIHRSFLEAYSHSYIFKEFGNRINWEGLPCIDSLIYIDTLYANINISLLTYNQQEIIQQIYDEYKNMYIKTISVYFANENSVNSIIKEINTKNKKIKISAFAIEFNKKIQSLLTSSTKTKRETVDQINKYSSRFQYCN